MTLSFTNIICYMLETIINLYMSVYHSSTTDLPWKHTESPLLYIVYVQCTCMRMLLYQIVFGMCRFNSLWPGDVTWRKRSWSTVIEVMSCRLFGTKRLPVPNYCRTDPRGISNKKKIHLKMSLCGFCAKLSHPFTLTTASDKGILILT